MKPHVFRREAKLSAETQSHIVRAASSRLCLRGASGCQASQQIPELELCVDVFCQNECPTKHLHPPRLLHHLHGLESYLAITSKMASIRHLRSCTCDSGRSGGGLEQEICGLAADGNGGRHETSDTVSKMRIETYFLVLVDGIATPCEENSVHCPRKIQVLSACQRFEESGHGASSRHQAVPNSYGVQK